MGIDDQFNYDVFLSHSSRDRDVVRKLAERLQGDGLRVWLDDWEIKPGDHIPAKIDEGLEQSRILVLCMSAAALGSEWAELESQTFRFRDPLNKSRRFIPLRLDDSPVKSSLAPFLSINWHNTAQREQEYAKLLEGCQRTAQPTKAEALGANELSAEKVLQLDGKPGFYGWAFEPNGRRVVTGHGDGNVRLWDLESARCLQVFEGHERVDAVAWTSDSQRVVSGGHDNTLRLWDVETGECIRVLAGHTRTIESVVFSSDNSRALSTSFDGVIRVWNVDTGDCIQSLDARERVRSAKWSPDERFVLSGGDDNILRLWDVKTARCVRVFEGHTHWVLSAVWSADQRFGLSGSVDNTVRLWDIETGRCVRVLEGHTANTQSVAWNANDRFVISGSGDGTLRLWDVSSGRCLRVFRGHKEPVAAVSWSADGRRVFSGDLNGGIWVWDISELLTGPLETTALVFSSPSLVERAETQLQYTNAKVLVVGDSGVGKTWLSNYLAHGIAVEVDKPIPSTDGAWTTQWKLPHSYTTKEGVEREIWLWDFAGQVDYRLVHQLFMDETSAAVLVFDPQRENPYEGLGQWDRDLQKASRKPFAKLLVAGRIDRGGLIVSEASLDKFSAERGFETPLHKTSAVTGEGCDELREAIINAIDWDSIPITTSSVLYHRMKEEILALRDNGIVLMRLGELKQRMELSLANEQLTLDELQTAIGHLAGPGMIQRLDFGGFILLRPEVLSRYGAALVRTVRKHPQELGCVREDDLLVGALDYQDFERLTGEDEVIVLRTLHETVVSRAWCLRQTGDDGAILTFPSYFRRERPPAPERPRELVTYRFTGPIDEIYATLVVRLHHTVAFDTNDLWRDAADFITQTGGKLGLKLTREAEGSARLDAYFDPAVDENSRVLFMRYAHEHLRGQAISFERLRRYYCTNRKCDSRDEPFPVQPLIDKALAPGGKGRVNCPDCGRKIELRDAMEEKFDSPEIKEEVRQEQIESQAVIDNESRELILVGHAYAIAAEAGQIYRGYTNSDHGIDGEIEFKDDEGRATGQRLYLQLKSGKSYLTKRKRDDAEVFQVKNPRWVSYWQQQAYPVMLVIRTEDGTIRWMDVSDYLRRETDGGSKTVKQVEFDGEVFSALSVRQWRKKMLGGAG